MKLRTGDDDPRERLIVALDVRDRASAMQLVGELGAHVGLFKIGLQLFIAEGPDIVRSVVDAGGRVFLDLKLHDIPNTVARSIESAAKLGASMLTLHTGGGAEMIRAAVAAGPDDLLLLGVTVLTSSDRETLRSTGVAASVEDHVLGLAKLAHAAGLCGFVASAHELDVLRSELPSKSKIVVPGIRMGGADPGDQKRVTRPRDAIARGADYIVVGRPITGAPDRVAACAQIVGEIAAAH